MTNEAPNEVKTKNKYTWTVIYFAVTFAIMFLTVLNIAGKGYKLLTTGVASKEITDEAGNTRQIYTTEKITLTKGRYQFIVNYATTVDAKIEACVERDPIAEGILEANAESGYHVMELQLDRSTSEFYFKVTDPADLSIYNYEIIKDGHIVYDDIYYAILFFLFSCFIYFIISRYRCGKYDLGKLITMLSLTAITIFVSSPIFTEYLVWGFDLDFHLSRIEGIKDAFLDGQFIPIIYPNCNNGYGVLGFMYPYIFLIPSALLRMCGVSMVAAYHFFVLMVNIMTVASAYIASRSFTKSYKISIACTLLCACNPLRLLNVYQGAAYGALLAITFMPLVFAGLYEVFYGNKKKWYLLTIGFTCMIMSHLLSSIFVAIVSFIVFMPSVKELFDREEKRYIELLKAVGVFLLVNSWYLIIFLLLYRYPLNEVVIMNSDYWNDAIIPTKLFMMNASNEYCPAVEDGIRNGFSMSIGIAGLMCLFIMLLDVLIPDPEDKKWKKWLAICLVIMAGCIYSGLSVFPWKKLSEIGVLDKFMTISQWPSRPHEEFAAIIFFFGPISLERIASRKSDFIKERREYFTPILAVMGVFSIILSYTVMDTHNVQQPFKTVWSGGYASFPLGEYLPENTDTSVFDSVEPHNFGSETISFEQSGTSAVIECKTYDEGAYVLLPMLYYPFYLATGEDGTKYEIGRCPDGRIQIFMPVTDNIQKIYVKYL